MRHTGIASIIIKLCCLVVAVLTISNTSHAFVIEGVKLKALRVVDGYNDVPYFSHEKLTRLAIWQTMVEEVEPKFFDWNKLQEDWFFEISRANEAVDDDQKSSEKHYDNGKFLEANNRLLEKKREIREALSNGDRHLARKLLGQALHTVQDFYSHTNWFALRASYPWMIFTEEYPFHGCSNPPKNPIPVVKLLDNDHIKESYVKSERYNGKYDVTPGSHCAESQDFPLPITDSSNPRQIWECLFVQAFAPFANFTLPLHLRHYGAAVSAIIASMKFIREAMTPYDFEYLVGIDKECHPHSKEWKTFNSRSVFLYYYNEADIAYDEWHKRHLNQNNR